MSVIKKRKEQLMATPVQAAQEGDDEPPDPNPCRALGIPLSIPRPAARLVRLPSAQRAATLNPAAKSFRKRHFADVPAKLWNDWQWQTSHRIRSLTQLERMITLSDPEREALAGTAAALPLGITPYYMSLVSPDDPQQPIRRCVVHTAADGDCSTLAAAWAVSDGCAQRSRLARPAVPAGDAWAAHRDRRPPRRSRSGWRPGSRRSGRSARPARRGASRRSAPCPRRRGCAPRRGARYARRARARDAGCA